MSLLFFVPSSVQALSVEAQSFVTGAGKQLTVVSFAAG
jgi:hypothetical protein